MTAEPDPTPPYGRIVRNDDGNVVSIVEERDASREEKKIREVNTSHYCFSARTVLPLLSEIGSDNDQNEYYLTDIAEILASRGEKVMARSTEDLNVLMGVNSRGDLARISKILQAAICETWMEKGVTIVSPESVTIEPDVKIGRDTVIHPYTTLSGNTVVGSGCVIGPQTRLNNAKVGNHVRVEFSVIDNRSIKNDSVIGPFASLETFE